jgi:DNA-binding winged helix-turn-helix (wHTH) protein
MSPKNTRLSSHEIGPEHPVTYRKEILAQLFAFLTAGESTAVIASASMGKSRLVQFLLREDVAQHYLGEDAEQLLLVWLDCNRLGDFTAWHLYELFLDALLAAVEERPHLVTLRDEYRPLHLEVIRSENALLAQRVVERLTRTLCREHGLKIGMVLDEFDDAYAQLPSQVLAGMRGMRDANKYRLCYLLFTRDHPEYLRDPADGEGLYEQFSRNVLYLQPYQHEDAHHVIAQLAERIRVAPDRLSPSVVEQIVTLSGGHPGLMVALLSGLAGEPPPRSISFADWAMQLEKVHEECRKLHEGLRAQERRTMLYVANGASVAHQQWEPLRQKGLIRRDPNQGLCIFSPLLQAYLHGQAMPGNTGLAIDPDAGIVSVDGQRVVDLSGLPYDLLIYLYRRQGEVCEREEIMNAIYKEANANGQENRLDAVVTRLRKQIEQDSRNPQYVKTVRGRGFCLVLEPDKEPT